MGRPRPTDEMPPQAEKKSPVLELVGCSSGVTVPVDETELSTTANPTVCLPGSTSSDGKLMSIPESAWCMVRAVVPAMCGGRSFNSGVQGEWSDTMVWMHESGAA